MLLTPKQADSAGNLMKRLGQRYDQYINKTYRRSGTLWEGRFRSCVIEKQEYLFTCRRYIEMNPVRAGIVEHPGEYRWSSYGANGQGASSKVLRPHELYRHLGQNTEERSELYRQMFRHELARGEIDKIRKATNGNYALGNGHFAAEIEKMLGRRVVAGKAGRPKSVVVPHE